MPILVNANAGDAGDNVGASGGDGVADGSNSYSNAPNTNCPVDVICCDKLVIPEHISFNGNGKLLHGVVVVCVGGKLKSITIASQYGKLLCCDIHANACLLYTSPSPRDRQKSRMPSSA